VTTTKPPPSDALQNLLGRHWHHLPASEVGQLLKTNLETGLDLFTVRHRQEQFGLNQLTPRKGQSAWMRFRLVPSVDVFGQVVNHLLAGGCMRGQHVAN
jgi:hypothetical protein